MKQTITSYLIKAIALCSLIALLFSCNAEKRLIKSYKKVAADPAPVGNFKKGILAGWVLANFPNEEKTIVKDSIVNNYITSVVSDTITVVKDNEVYKYIYNVDTLVVQSFKTKTVTIKDTVGNFIKQQRYNQLSDSLSHYKGNNIVLNIKLSNAENDLTNAFKTINKQRLWILLLLVLLVASHFVRSKIKI